MASIRISQLPEITTVTNDDVFVINDGDTETRKITYSNLTAGLVPDVMSNVGDLITRDASNTTAGLPIGGLGQVLTVQSDGTANWQDPSAGFSDPMTTAGDIIARDVTNTTTRVGIGSAGQVLTVGGSGNEVLWQDAPGVALAADVSANTLAIATNTAAIATNITDIADNDTDIAGLQSDVVALDSRVDALELVTGSTLLYDVESVAGSTPTGVGKFSVNSTDPSLVTQIKMGALDKNNVPPSTPVNGDTLLFIDPAGTGVEHRYVIDDASSGLSNLTVTNVLTSGDAWAVGVEYETYLFPTNKSAVVIGPTIPSAPELGAIWIDSGSLIWYAWTGAIWTPAHLPPSMETRISSIETQQAANVTNIATNAAAIQSNDADISANAASIVTNTAAIATNTADIATNAADIATNAAGIATNTADIATNTANIATNAADIAARDTDIAANAAAIATNTTDIATNATSIATNVTDIATNTANIAANTTDIATNATNIATNVTDIATNAADIATNQTDIATNAAEIASKGGDIAANAANIATNTSDIATNATNIATNTSDIATNTSDIATNTSDLTVLALDVTTNQTDIAANAANIATNTANIAANTTDIATNTTDIASNDADISANTSAIGSLDARVDALELVTGATLLYDVENIAGAAPTGSGNFTVNSSDASLVTQIQMGALDKNGLLPSTPVDGDTLLFRDSANTGIEHRYLIDDASSGLADLTVTNVLTSGDAWVAGVEYETYLFPTNKSAVVVDVAAPLAPDVGAIWIDSGSLIWYAWTGAAWVPAHLPPSMETRISGIETQQTQNTADIATFSADIAINAAEIANNDASISANATAISTNTINIAANASDIATNASAIATNTADIATNTADIATNSGDIATNASAIAANTTDIATNSGDIATNTADIATNAAEISTKISEADGDARYLQLSGGTLTGTVTSEKKVTVNAPRDPSVATNSFVIKGNLGGVESQSLLYDYRTPSGSSLDSKVVYKGPVVEDDEIATKKYVDDEIASIPTGGSNPYTFYTVSSTGTTWYELINLRSNNTYEVLVELSSPGLSGSASLKVGADGTPSRNSFIELGTVVGTGNYKFRISDANTLDVEPLDSGTVNIRVTITGDASTTGGSDLVMSASASAATSSYVQTPNVDGLRGGGIFTTTSQTHVLDYSNSVQLANVADPTDGTMVGDRAYNDARYEPLGGGAAYTGGNWGSNFGPISLTNALAGIDNYRKVVAFQVFEGTHTDPPGWGATSGTSNTLVNFSTNVDKMGLQWDEGSSNNRTIFAVNKSTITGSGNYLRNSNQILLVNNASVTSNRVSPSTGVFFTFEFFRGNGCGLGCGWTANVHVEYINNDGRATASRAVVSCNAINASNMKDLVLWGQSGYGSFGRWNVVADY